MHELVFRDEAQAAMHKALVEGPAAEALAEITAHDARYGGMGNPASAPEEPAASAPPVDNPPEGTTDTKGSTEPKGEPTSSAEPAKKDLVFGKYEDLPAAQKGYYEIVKAYSAERDARAKLESELVSIRSTPAPAPAVPQRPMPVSQPSEDMTQLLAALESDGVDAGALTKVIESITERKAADLLEARLGPREAQERATAYIASKYPTAAQFSDEIIAYVANDADTRERVQSYLSHGDMIAAQEIAILRFQHAMNSKTEADLLAAAEATQRETEKARATATMIKGAQSGVKVAAPKGPTAEEMERLAERARMGDQMPYLRATIGATLTDPIFSPDYEG